MSREQNGDEQEWEMYINSGYRIPESRSEFCMMVSLTAANTSRTLVVSVAWVRLGIEST